MKLFIKRFWGFDPETTPVVMFSSDTYKDKLLKESSPGDRIAFVATKNENTMDEGERGRILGMAEIGRIAVDTLSAIDRATLSDRLFENGKMRFPKAIPMTRAWRFDDPPDLVELLDRQLPMSAIRGSVLLDEEEAELLLALPHSEVALPALESIERARALSDNLQDLSPSKGPPPSSGSRSGQVPERDFGFVYGLRFGRREVWKVGNSWQPEKRREAFNRNIPSVVIGEKWEEAFQQKTMSPDSAFRLEQEIIASLAAAGYSIGGEMFRCAEKDFLSIWSRLVHEHIHRAEV